MSKLDITTSNPVNNSAASYAVGSAVTLNTSTQTNVGWVEVLDRDGDALVELLVGGGQALTSLQVTRSGYIGGHLAGNQKVVQADADLDTPTNFVKESVPASAYVAADGTRIQLKINCDGAAEIGIHAKSNAGTLQIVQINLPATTLAA